MSWKCPTCGRQNIETFKNCICGHYGESIVIEHRLMDDQDASIESGQFLKIPPDGTGNHMPLSQGAPESHKVKVPGRADSKSNTPPEEVIKEIESWLFTFSHVDNCISIGTPALQSFRLKLALKDIEDLLEFLYQKTGKEKTTRKIGLSPKETADVIDKVDRMIEEKRSRVTLKFTSDEIQEIADLINVKLKV